MSKTENKPKIKKKKAISPTNIIPNQKTTKDDTTVEKIFKIQK